MTHTSSEKCLCNGQYLLQRQLVTVWRVSVCRVLSHVRDIYITHHPNKAHGTPQRRGQNDNKSQRLRRTEVKLCVCYDQTCKSVNIPTQRGEGHKSPHPN